MLVLRRIDATNFHCNVRKDIPKNVLTSNLNEKNVRSDTQEAIGLCSLLDSECKSPKTQVSNWCNLQSLLG